MVYQEANYDNHDSQTPTLVGPHVFVKCLMLLDVELLFNGNVKYGLE